MTYPSDSMTIRQLCRDSHYVSKEKGWWIEGERNFGELMMLAVSELAEVFEEWRSGRDYKEVYYNEERPDKPEGIPIEIADVFIRLADNCEAFGIDLDTALDLKMRYNLTRPYRHGGKRA